jgi:uncharacterized protein YqgC (DUF456 family)
MYAKSFLNTVDEVKKKDTNTIITETTKGTMIGASIGAGIGLFIGFGKQKNLIMSAFIGAVLGGAISRIFITKK